MKKQVSKETVIRTIVLGFALLNQVLVLCGLNPLPFSNEEVFSAFTALFTVGASLWAWWKNNSFTKEAIEADEVMRALKREGGLGDEQ